MDNEYKWVISAVLIFVALVVTGSSFSNYVDNQAMLKMVQSGASPIEAQCAVKSADKVVCGAIVVKK